MKWSRLTVPGRKPGFSCRARFVRIALFGFPDKALFNPDLLAVVKDAVDRMGENAYDTLLPQKETLITQFQANIVTVQDANKEPSIL